ncbi:MAG: hypothetical protein S4CHLAM2_18060 [Chlamydiales bacterium]|nr:hypothetical protein [Chlamydiales bacterium]
MHLIRACKAFFYALKNEAAQESEPSKEEPSHLRLLALLQKEGRLIDFLKEDISSYSDAQVGAAVRTIHAKCGDVLEEVVTLRPLLPDSEGSTLSVPVGYDVAAIQVTGRVKGEPPYQGVLRHKGWKAHKISLPKQLVLAERSVICPAEVEVL